MSISTLARVFTPHGNIVYTANDFRQTLRIVFAGMIALSISSFYNTSYGVFFVVYPIMLLSLVPVFNRHVAKQFIFSASLNCVEMVIIIGYLSQWPAIMTLVVFALYVMRFRFMSKGPLFLFGSMGVVCQSTMLNFMSYPTTNWHTLLFSNIEASVMAVCLSALMNYLLPDVEPRKPPPLIEKDDARVRHESLLSGSVATMIFVVFQISDLSDSLSALMAGILILFPMHYRGAVMSSIWRVVGVVLGCLYILVVQLILYDHSSHMLLMMPLIGLGLAFGARLHVMEKVGAGVGFFQHHDHRHYVRAEHAPGQRPGVQRSLSHHLRDLFAGGDADDGLSGAFDPEPFRRHALRHSGLIAFAAAEAPVLSGRKLDNDHHVSTVNAHLLIQLRSQLVVEGRFLFSAPRFTSNDIKQYRPLRSARAEIVPINVSIPGREAFKKMEPVLFGNGEGFRQRLVQNVRDLLLLHLAIAVTRHDTNKRHYCFSSARLLSALTAAGQPA